MVFPSEQKMDKIGQQRAVSRRRRQIREREDRQEGESWTRHGVRGLPNTISQTTQEINANERDAARLRKSREQVRKREVHWGVEDNGESPKSDAGD